jgi:hypothetical protein
MPIFVNKIKKVKKSNEGGCRSILLPINHGILSPVIWLTNGLLRIIIIGADCQVVLCKLEGFVPLVLIFVNKHAVFVFI